MMFRMACLTLSEFCTLLGEIGGKGEKNIIVLYREFGALLNARYPYSI